MTLHRPAAAARGPAERALVRKLDVFILGFCCLSYLVNYLDRSNLANAYVSGMRDELGLMGNQLNEINTCFTVGYIVGQIPSNLAILHVRPGWWLPLTMVLWGGLTAAGAAAHSPGALMALRFFQGLCEASTFAGTHFVLGAWYTERELGKRSGVFTSSGLIGTAAGGFIQTGLYRGLDGRRGLSGWRWLFIVDGLLTLPVALFGYMLFPDTPSTTKAVYLTLGERELARSRMIGPTAADDGINDGSGPSPSSLLTSRFLVMVLTSWYWWGFVGLWILAGEVESFSSNALLALYMQSHPTRRFSVAQLNNYPTGVAAVGIVSTLCWATLTDRLDGKRYLVAYFAAATGIATAIMVLAAARLPSSPSDTQEAATRVVFAAYYWAGATYALQATMFAWCNGAMVYGMWAMIGCSVALALWTAGLSRLERRKRRQQSVIDDQQASTQVLENGISSFRDK